MRYKIDLNNLSEELKFIKDKNDLLQKSITNLNKNLTNLKWESSNREGFNNNYLNVINRLAKLQYKTDSLLTMLTKKYNLYDELYESKIKTISNKDYEGEFNYDKYKY
jgi:septal ring factor EnvC (AmiA/AmiB activator)